MRAPPRRSARFYLRRGVGVAALKDSRPAPLVETAIQLCERHFHAGDSRAEVTVPGA